MDAISLEKQFGAYNYHPLPVTLTRGAGVYVWDDTGKRYLDMMSAYSAISHGHCHPELVAALTEQAQTLAVCSRAFYSDKLGPFLQKACLITGMDRALPMNSGAEAVETAVKAARKWAYQVKKVPANQAEIIVCQGNFHGRTTTIVSFSTEPQYQQDFGPLTPGFRVVPYGDSKALQAAITPNTAAFLIEPIQGEAGIIVPPPGYLAAAKAICEKNNILFIADEIQTGLGRTGKLLACQHENIQPDGLILGKALGGGLLPVSLFLTTSAVMDLFKPGDHGSTFGGNPLAAVVATKALEILERDKYADAAVQRGEELKRGLNDIKSPVIKAVRGKGLLLGLEINDTITTAREFCLRLRDHGVLSKETHETVVRLAPPLIINAEQIQFALQQIRNVVESFKGS